MIAQHAQNVVLGEDHQKIAGAVFRAQVHRSALPASVPDAMLHMLWTARMQRAADARPGTRQTLIETNVMYAKETHTLDLVAGVSNA